MVTINQKGVVPVAAVHPRVMATFEKVKGFQLAVRQSESEHLLVRADLLIQLQKAIVSRGLKRA